MSNGQVLSEAPIAVDFWPKQKHNLENKLLFLSHCHSDHTKGLDKSWSQPIYTSETNSLILINVIGLKEKYIKTLSINVRHRLETSTGIEIYVRLIDAEHCPGAVMYLFEGIFTRNIRSSIIYIDLWKSQNKKNFKNRIR